MAGFLRITGSAVAEIVYLRSENEQLRAALRACHDAMIWEGAQGDGVAEGAPLDALMRARELLGIETVSGPELLATVRLSGETVARVQEAMGREESGGETA